MLGSLLVVLGFLEVAVTRNLSGIWLALVGLFLSWAANTEQRTIALTNLLAGATVADVVRTIPVCGYENQTVEAFVRSVASRCTYRRFPVLTIEGRVLGTTSLRQLAQVPESQRVAVRLAALATPLRSDEVLNADQPLADAVRATQTGRLVPVVDAAGSLVGVVEGDDLAHAVELAALGVPPGRDRADITAGTPPRLGLG